MKKLLGLCCLYESSESNRTPNPIEKENICDDQCLSSNSASEEQVVVIEEKSLDKEEVLSPPKQDPSLLLDPFEENSNNQAPSHPIIETEKKPFPTQPYKEKKKKRPRNKSKTKRESKTLASNDIPKQQNKRDSATAFSPPPLDAMPLKGILKTSNNKSKINVR